MASFPEDGDWVGVLSRGVPYLQGKLHIAANVRDDPASANIPLPRVRLAETLCGQRSRRVVPVHDMSAEKCAHCTAAAQIIARLLKGQEAEGV